MGAVRGSPVDSNPVQATQREPVTPWGNSVLGDLKESGLEHPHTNLHERFGLQADVKSLLWH